MKLADLPIIKIKRVMTSDEASELVGDMVPDLDADCHEAGIYVDEDTEEIILAYFPMEEEVNLLRRSVLNIKYATTKRANGIDNASRTFGMSPRKVFAQRESCKPSGLALDQPTEHAVLVSFSRKFQQMFQEFAPEVFEADQRTLKESGIGDEWRMTDDSLWTSGVVNKSATLPYHRDSFNFNTWSAMPVVRRDMRGGYLNFPEYNITCACRDGWVLFFAGYKYVHGVTPMTPLKEDAYRYSIVYYALRGMKDCFTFAVETAKGKENRTKREQHMAKVITGEEDSYFAKK